ncbi:uncharacterized protein LOC132725478 [Ruditapes philippinarum]|uniref:uncharacterized protein LOC132725478 n=1 Tax=Ruditapes philippinarum TaxID=129788 RepID=UPI00295B8FA7|nr:uncharacterized protein LOC132725478 [Ruditapes philippinarum]
MSVPRTKRRRVIAYGSYNGSKVVNIFRCGECQGYFPSLKSMDEHFRSYTDNLNDNPNCNNSTAAESVKLKSVSSKEECQPPEKICRRSPSKTEIINEGSHKDKSDETEIDRDFTLKRKQGHLDIISEEIPHQTYENRKDLNLRKKNIAIAKVFESNISKTPTSLIQVLNRSESQHENHCRKIASANTFVWNTEVFYTDMTEESFGLSDGIKSYSSKVDPVPKTDNVCKTFHQTGEEKTFGVTNCHSLIDTHSLETKQNVATVVQNANNSLLREQCTDIMTDKDRPVCQLFPLDNLEEKNNIHISSNVPKQTVEKFVVANNKMNTDIVEENVLLAENPDAVSERTMSSNDRNRYFLRKRAVRSYCESNLEKDQSDNEQSSDTESLFDTGYSVDLDNLSDGESISDTGSLNDTDDLNLCDITGLNDTKDLNNSDTRDKSISLRDTCQSINIENKADKRQINSSNDMAYVKCEETGECIAAVDMSKDARENKMNSDNEAKNSKLKTDHISKEKMPINTTRKLNINIDVRKFQTDTLPKKPTNAAIISQSKRSDKNLREKDCSYDNCHSCDRCKTQFTTTNCYINHLILYHNPAFTRKELTKCPICQRSYDSFINSRLRCHLMLHFLCEMKCLRCSLRFASVIDLQRHLLVCKSNSNYIKIRKLNGLFYHCNIECVKCKFFHIYNPIGQAEALINDILQTMPEEKEVNILKEKFEAIEKNIYNHAPTRIRCLKCNNIFEYISCAVNHVALIHMTESDRNNFHMLNKISFVFNCETCKQRHGVGICEKYKKLFYRKAFGNVLSANESNTLNYNDRNVISLIKQGFVNCFGLESIASFSGRFICKECNSKAWTFACSLNHLIVCHFDELTKETILEASFFQRRNSKCHCKTRHLFSFCDFQLFKDCLSRAFDGTSENENISQEKKCSEKDLLDVNKFMKVLINERNIIAELQKKDATCQSVENANEMEHISQDMKHRIAEVNGTFICQVCHSDFKHISCCKNHVLTEHGYYFSYQPGSAVYTCPVCKKHFHGLNILNGHLQHHHTIYKFTCVKCDERFNSHRNDHFKYCKSFIKKIFNQQLSCNDCDQIHNCIVSSKEKELINGYSTGKEAIFSRIRNNQTNFLQGKKKGSDRSDMKDTDMKDSTTHFQENQSNDDMIQGSKHGNKEHSGSSTEKYEIYGQDDHSRPGMEEGSNSSHEDHTYSCKVVGSCGKGNDSASGLKENSSLGQEEHTHYCLKGSSTHGQKDNTSSEIKVSATPDQENTNISDIEDCAIRGLEDYSSLDTLKILKHGQNKATCSGMQEDAVKGLVEQSSSDTVEHLRHDDKENSISSMKECSARCQEDHSSFDITEIATHDQEKHSVSGIKEDAIHVQENNLSVLKSIRHDQKDLSGSSMKENATNGEVEQSNPTIMERLGHDKEDNPSSDIEEGVTNGKVEHSISDSLVCSRNGENPILNTGMQEGKMNCKDGHFSSGFEDNAKHDQEDDSTYGLKEGTPYGRKGPNTAFVQEKSSKSELKSQTRDILNPQAENHTEHDVIDNVDYENLDDVECRSEKVTRAQNESSEWKPSNFDVMFNGNYFFCLFCLAKFEDLECCYTHVLLKHCISNAFKCIICDHLLYRKLSYISHLRRFHDLDSIYCEHCYAGYDDIAYRDEHVVACKKTKIQLSDRAKTYMCKKCYTIHVKMSDRDKTTSCEECELGFANIVCAKNHFFMKHFPSWVILSSSNTVFKCPCGKNVLTKAELKVHVQTDHGSTLGEQKENEALQISTSTRLEYIDFDFYFKALQADGKCIGCEHFHIIDSKTVTIKESKETTCKICKIKFSTNTCLRNHMLNTHGDKYNMRQCVGCGLYCAGLAVLERHQKKQFFDNEHETCVNESDDCVEMTCQRSMPIFECDKCEEIHQHKFMMDEQKFNDAKPPEKFSEERVKKMYCQKKINVCKICNIQIESRRLYLQHVKQYHEKKENKKGDFCQICKKRIESNVFLMEHIQQEHCTFKIVQGEVYNNISRNFSCEYCGETFSFFIDAQMHLRLKHFEKPLTVKKHFSTEIQNRKGFHVMHCPVCFEYCPDINTLAHLKSHFNTDNIVKQTKEFICDICGKIYHKKATFAAHKLKHTGIRKFKCNICEKSFLYESNLQTHVLVHGEKKEECKVCGMKFTLPHHVRAHMQRKHPKKS